MDGTTVGMGMVALAAAIFAWDQRAERRRWEGEAERLRARLLEKHAELTAARDEYSCRTRERHGVAG